MTIESLAAVESTLAPWRVGNTWPDDLLTTVEAGLCGIALLESSLALGDDMRSVIHLAGSALRATAVQPTVASILPGPADDTNPGTRIKMLCHSVRRLASFNPIAIAIGAASTEAVGDVSENGLVLSGIQQIARAGAFLHPHAASVAILSSSLGCPAARLSAVIAGLDEPNLRVVLEVSKVPNRQDLEHWAANSHLLATVRLQVRASTPSSVTAIFEAPDVDLDTTAAVLYEAGFRGFYEVEFQAPQHRMTPTKTGQLVELLINARDMVRAAVRPHLAKVTSA
jgi:hypothetical protein